MATEDAEVLASGDDVRVGPFICALIDRVTRCRSRSPRRSASRIDEEPHDQVVVAQLQARAAAPLLPVS